MLLIVLVVQPETAHAQPIFEENIDHESERHRKSVRENSFLVVLHPLPAHVSRPDALWRRQKDANDVLFPGISPASSETMKFLSAAPSSDALGLPISPEIEIDDRIAGLIRRLDDNNDWFITETITYPFFDDPGFRDQRKVQANEYAEAYDVNGVLFLEFAFLFTPRLDQLRVVCKVGAYQTVGKKFILLPTSKSDMIVDYLSESQGPVLRPWHDGEKEEIILAIEEVYEQQVARWPHNKRDYKRERKKALAEIVDRTEIPIATAIQEGWTSAEIEKQLRIGITQIESLLANPMAKLSDEKSRKRKVKGKRTEFTYVDWNGRRVKKRARIIKSTDGRTVYQDWEGNIYSIPDA